METGPSSSIPTIDFMQCSAKRFKNWGQCPISFEKVGTFPKVGGHNQKKYGKMTLDQK